MRSIGNAPSKKKKVRSPFTHLLHGAYLHIRNRPTGQNITRDKTIKASVFQIAFRAFCVVDNEDVTD